MKSLQYYKNYFTLRLIKTFIQRFPFLYRRIQLSRYKGTENVNQIVGPDSDIVIEGYPRSANSFAIRAFMLSNGMDAAIATHLHVYTHIVLGIHYKIPTMCLIRHPKDCVLSYAALKSRMAPIEEFKEKYNMLWLIKEYIYFYKNLKRYEGQFLMATFKEVTSDFGAVIKSLNDFSGSDFVPFEHNEENVEAVFNFHDATTYLGPSKKREDVKASYQSELNPLMQTKAYKEALELYEYWAKND